MELLANDLSFHGQFHDLQSFRAAFDRLMELRKIARRFGREVHCHRAMLQVAPLPAMSLQHALGRLNKDEQRAALLWLRKSGPFWDDLRNRQKITERLLGTLPMLKAWVELKPSA